MRQFACLAAVSIAASLGGCAGQPEGDAATSADERVICRSDREIGSNMNRRVCKTAQEWEGERLEQQEGMRSIDRQPVEVPAATSDNTGG